MKSKNFHSTSVVIEDCGIMILGSAGSGKSDLALRLIDSGATLISDDITICKKKTNGIFLLSPKETKGLIEVREIGIITVPFVENVKLSLLVKLLDREGERLPKKTKTILLGVQVPTIKIFGKNPSSVAKIKFKLNEVREIS
mgnify:CR=1 FL=1